MFKNLSIRNKLILVLSPITLALFILLIVFYTTVNSTYRDSRDIFYVDLYATHVNILSSDRDFYQANEAALRIDSLDGSDADQLTDLKAAYKENVQQTLDNINKIPEYLQDDSQLLNYYTPHNLFVLLNGSESADDPNGFLQKDKTMKALLEEFNTNFAIWQSAYNPETGEGDFSKMDTAFNTTRVSLDEMQDLLTLYGEYSSGQLEDIIQATAVQVTVVAFFLL